MIGTGVPAPPQTRGYVSFSLVTRRGGSRGNQRVKTRPHPFPPLRLQTPQTEAHCRVLPHFHIKNLAKYSQGRPAAEITKGSWTIETDLNPFRISQPFLNVASSYVNDESSRKFSIYPTRQEGSELLFFDSPSVPRVNTVSELHAV